MSIIFLPFQPCRTACAVTIKMFSQIYSEQRVHAIYTSKLLFVPLIQYLIRCGKSEIEGHSKFSHIFHQLFTDRTNVYGNK